MKKIYIIIGFSLLIVGLFIYNKIYVDNYNFSLNGKDYLVINVGDEWSDPLYTVDNDKTIYTTMEQNGNGQKQLQIELKEDVAQGVYSNLAMITHSSSEFVMDFISILPGMAKAQVKSRVIMSPEHAKRLLLALQDNVAKYENAFGTIEMKAQKGTYMPPISDFHGEA